jgi:thioredoxin reductase (NADPH)
MSDNEIIDVAVIGAGPAGMTAALYAARAGWNTVMFEQMMPGGQMGNTDRIDNYPGFAEGVEGYQLANNMSQQTAHFGVKTASAQIEAVQLAGDVKVIKAATGEYRARAVVLATGAHARLMGVPGEDELRGKGISYCATCDGNFFRGKDVIVYGGANTAVEDALYLSKICNTVTIVYRRDHVRATAIYTKAAEAADNVRFAYRSVIERVEGEDGKVSGAVIKNVDTGATTEIPASAVFVAIGSVPNTALFEGQLDLDAAGYIKADETCITAVPGVFVAGDIRTKPLRQVVTAVSDGAVAAEAATAYLSTHAAEHA